MMKKERVYELREEMRLGQSDLHCISNMFYDYALWTLYFEHVLQFCNIGICL